MSSSAARPPAMSGRACAGARKVVTDEGGATAVAIPWWRRPEVLAVLIPLAIYLASRLWVLAVTLVLQGDQVAMLHSNPNIRIYHEHPAAPGYLAVMTNWDAQWYERIAIEGYPAELPRRADGMVDMNPWAFFPVFPMLCGLVMKLTGLSFITVGPILATLIGAVAAWQLFALVDKTVGRWAAVFVTTATCFYMAAPVMSAAYTESAALLMVVVCLRLLRARQYAWLAFALLVLALTRNVVAVMVPVIIVHGLIRAYHGDEGHRPWLTRGALAALAAWSTALIWLWPTIMEKVTGVPDAYAETLKPWGIAAMDIKVGAWWDWGRDILSDVGFVAVVVGLLAWAAWMFAGPAFRWGPELWAWGGAYPAYMLAVVATTPSVIRYAMLAFPFALVILWAVDEGARALRAAWLRPAALAVIIGVGMFLQVMWLRHFFIVDDYDLWMLYP